MQIKSYPTLNRTLKKYIEKSSEILLLNVSTEDGFTLSHLSEVDIEHDKVAAMTSSLSSMSKAACKMLGAEDYSISMLEADDLNLYFLKSTFKGDVCVISACAKNKLSLGQARFLLKQLNDDIKALPF